MKRNNGQNIITDRDVTVTGTSNLGNSLDTVIEEFSEDIYDIKSQLKWTHKYGAVGSGHGGGGGTSKWSIVATLDGQTIEDGKVISLSKGVNTYNLRIAISGGSDSYYITYGYGGVSYSIELSSANKWRADLSIPLNSNGTVFIEATDNILIKNVYSSYIVVPYKFSDIQLCRDFEHHGLEEYVNPNIFINTAIEEGLYVKFDYDITVNAECSYTWKFLNHIETGTISDKKGYVTYNLADVLNITSANANSYNVELTIEISPENQSSHVIEKTIVFNLIPNGLYLQLVPQNGLVYDSISDDIDSIYKYSINREIGFQTKVYNGLNSGNDARVYYWIDDDPMPSEGHLVIERQTNVFAVSYRTEGWHQVHFRVQMSSDAYTVTKYLYCQQAASEFNWFRSANPVLQFGYKGYSSEQTIGNVSPLIDSNYIRIYRANNEDTVYNLANPDVLSDELSNALINISVQYSEINNNSEPICTLVSTDNRDFIKIYQNKISFSGLSNNTLDCNFFFPKEKNYTPGDVEKYHLITISIAAVYFNGSEVLYEYNVYLDGVLEGALNSWPTALKVVKSFNFNPGNYCVNHFSIDYFEGGRGISLLKDSDINYYYYSYKVASRNSMSAVSEQEKNILNFLYDPTTNESNYTMEHDLIKLNNTTFYDDVAINTTIPTLVLQVSEIQDTIQGNPSIFNWMNNNYSQDSADVLANAKISTKLKWGVGAKTESINIQVDNHEFFIKLQGSSTMNNKSKNFTLGIQKRTQDDGPIVLFSPNFVKEDSSTFLPETSFTLKADVVDSSHTNNVAMGRFINDWNNFDYDMHQSGVDVDILSHVRKCLDGFPTLVYLETLGIDGQTITGDYFLGIYSFNLGRDSYFNLGYSDLSQLNPEYIVDATPTTFSFTTVGSGTSRGLDPIEGFVSAEVQDNRIYWDFSQYDDTILFQQGDEVSDFMFGDIATYSGNLGANNSIQEFVRKVSRAGGYVFKEMGKNFVNVKNENAPDSVEYSYHVPNVVPDYRTQYTRSNTDYSIKEVVDDAQYADLLECVGGEQDGELIDGYVNFNSLSNYYTTCMTFGLVDSVQKNLTIKTWDGRQFGTFFYDMDTCLGRDNDGNATSYFCFSDYWRSDIREYDENDNLIDRAINPNAVAVKTINYGVTVDRDYFPLNGKVVGFDKPSSYLFALAKYLKTLPEYKNNETYKSPQTIYANWRTVGGPLETAETFINRYYASNLANVPDCLLNLNYRNKYLYYSNENNNKTSFDNISKYLFGRGIGTTTEWLNGRLHILDAYFNLESANIIINNNYVEPIPVVQNINRNEDIIILRDMFMEGNDPWRRKEGNVEFIVNAPDYTPLIIKSATNLKQFLLEDADIEYIIRTSLNGLQVSTFGGSQMWLYLESIDPFIQSSASTEIPLYLNNKYLEYISGTSGTYTGGFNFILPALKELHLTSRGYSGSLRLDETFGNLSVVDISNSGIALDINRSIVKTINASDINSPSLNISNCNNLTYVDLTNATAENCTISPAWTNNIDVSNNKIKRLTITGKAVDGQYGTLSIRNNATMTTVGFDKFENIDIENCSKLTSLISNDASYSMIKDLKVIDCPNLTSISIYADGLQSLDLHGCTSLTNVVLIGEGDVFPNLINLNLKGTKVTNIKFSQNDDTTDIMDLSKFTNLGKRTGGTINLQDVPGIRIIKFTNSSDSPVKLTTSLSGCSDLERIYGNVAVSCSGCFDHLLKFSIHGADLSELRWKGSAVLDGNRVKHPLDITNNFFGTGETDTNMTLSAYDVSATFRYTNCTIFDYYYILYNVDTNVRNLNSLFEYNENLDWGAFDYSHNNNIDKRIFTNCEQITDMYFLFGRRSHKLYLQSPTINGENVTLDNGLFSPLKNVADLGGIFYGASYYCDRFLFRRANDNYKITTLTWFAPKACFNVPVEINEVAISSALENIENTGNLAGFFNNLGALTTIYGIFNGVNYIDYNHVFKIPTNCTCLLSCFVSAYASCDEFLLKNYFASPGKVTNIAQSFRQTSSSNTYKVIMLLENNTLSEFRNLEILGYDDKTNANFRGGYTASSFKGFVKQINPNGFPFNILQPCTNLTVVTGLFEDAECSVSLNNLKLPGTLFVNNPNLKETSRLFYDIKLPYQLSSGPNFQNCPNIEKVDYMFGSTSINSQYPMLSGPIPCEFFKHGGNVVEVTPLPGTNTRTEVEVDGQVTYEYGQLETPEPFTVFVPNNNISSMIGCFQHSNISSYINTDPTIEGNPDYNPYRYVQKDGEMIEAEITPRFTFMWQYDGKSKPSAYNINDYEMLDTMQDEDDFACVPLPISDSGQGNNTSSRNFIAPPDLLRYCTPSCKIDYLFAYCGLSGWSSTWNNTGGAYNMFGYGITGRICPYMLKPVYQTDSIKGLFKCCKKLSYYLRTDGVISTSYMIPETFFEYAPDIINLNQAFCDTLQPEFSDLTNTFKPLRRTIDITEIFYSTYWYGANQLTRVFKTNDIAATLRAFCIRLNTDLTSDRKIDQNIYFNDMFNSKYAGVAYATNQNFYQTFCGYSSNMEHFGTKTLTEEEWAHNYYTF